MIRVGSIVRLVRADPELLGVTWRVVVLNHLATLEPLQPYRRTYGVPTWGGTWVCESTAPIDAWPANLEEVTS